MSKKIILLAVFSAGLLFSCQKEQIVPGQNNSTLQEQPTYRGAVSNGNTEYDSGFTSNETENMDVVRDDYITDPNNDEDRNKKKKGNH